MEYGWFRSAWCFLRTGDESEKKRRVKRAEILFARRFPAVINYRQVIIKRPPSFLRSFLSFIKKYVHRAPREKLDLSRSLASRSERKAQRARSYLLDLLLPPLIFFVRSYYQDPCACPFKRQRDNGISRPSTSSRPCTSRLHVYPYSSIRSAISAQRMIKRISDVEMPSRKAHRWTAIQPVRFQCMY